MVALYRANAEALGRSFPAPQKRRPEGQPHDGEHSVSASTDMGNVSLVIPSIHPMLGLDCAPAGNHQPEFTAACITGTADRAVLDGATAMAWTCIDLATNAEQRARLLASRT
jgi:metal-dependent amidase/aminoacylase/carboxypeptidase family protein